MNPFEQRLFNRATSDARARYLEAESNAPTIRALYAEQAAALGIGPDCARLLGLSHSERAARIVQTA